MDKTSLALDFLSTKAVRLNPESPYLYASGCMVQYIVIIVCLYPIP